MALGKALAQRHDDVVYPGHPDLPEVPRGSLDDEWLPIIGRSGLVVITRDGRIRYRPVEKQLMVKYRVRGLILTGRKSQSTTDSLRIVERHWSRLQTLIDANPKGPWLYAVTEERLREMPLH